MYFWIVKFSVLQLLNALSYFGIHYEGGGALLCVPRKVYTSTLNFFKVWKKWFKFEKKYWFLVFWVQTTEEKKEKLGQEMQQCALIKVLVTLEEMFAPFDRTKEITNN